MPRHLALYMFSARLVWAYPSSARFWIVSGEKSLPSKPPTCSGRVIEMIRGDTNIAALRHSLVAGVVFEGITFRKVCDCLHQLGNFIEPMQQLHIFERSIGELKVLHPLGDLQQITGDRRLIGKQIHNINGPVDARRRVEPVENGAEWCVVE